MNEPARMTRQQVVALLATLGPANRLRLAAGLVERGEYGTAATLALDIAAELHALQVQRDRG